MLIIIIQSFWNIMKFCCSGNAQHYGNDRGKMENCFLLYKDLGRLMGNAWHMTCCGQAYWAVKYSSENVSQDTWCSLWESWQQHFVILWSINCNTKKKKKTRFWYLYYNKFLLLKREHSYHLVFDKMSLLAQNQLSYGATGTPWRS